MIIFGIEIELDPVAIIYFFAVMFIFLFDSILIVLSSTNEVSPYKKVILFFLNKNSIPEVNFFTI